MQNYLSEGFLLGIATGTSCMATCGPIYAPYLMQYERSLMRSLLALMEISAGRFATYLLIGLLAGLFGRSIPIDYREWFTAIAYLSFSLFLVLTAFRTRRREQCCKTDVWYAFVDRPLILGLLTGINFCPSFLLALTKAVDLSGPLSGMIFFAAFFAGTSLFLVPLSFFGLFGKQRLFRSIARVGAVVIGIWFIIQSILTIRQILSQ